MLHPFSHSVAFCCVYLGVYAQSLKPVIRFIYVRVSVCTLVYSKSFRLWKLFHGFLRNLTLNQGTLKRFETFDEARGIWENVRMLWKSPRYAPVMKSSTFGLGLRVHDGGTFSTHETDCRGLMSLHGFHKRIIFVRECWSAVVSD